MNSGWWTALGLGTLALAGIAVVAVVNSGSDDDDDDDGSDELAEADEPETIEEVFK